MCHRLLQVTFGTVMLYVCTHKRTQLRASNLHQPGLPQGSACTSADWNFLPTHSHQPGTCLTALQVVLAIVVVGLTAKALSTSLEVELESSNKERSNTDSYTEKPSGVEWQPWRPSTYAEPEITSIGSHFESFHPFRGRKLAMARAPTWSSRQLQAITSKAKFEMEITPGVSNQVCQPAQYSTCTCSLHALLLQHARVLAIHHSGVFRSTGHGQSLIQFESVWTVVASERTCSVITLIVGPGWLQLLCSTTHCLVAACNSFQ